MAGWESGYITKRGHDYGYSESERTEQICNENEGAPCNTCFHDWHERVHGSDSSEFTAQIATVGASMNP